MSRFAVLFCVLWAAVATAQTGAAIDVRLTDNLGHALPEGTLTLWPMNRLTQSDVRGEAAFEQLPAGEYRIEAAAYGFAARDTSLDLAPGEQANLTLALQKVEITLPEMIVETRRSANDVRVFGRREIGSSVARSLPEFLGSEAGLDVRTDGTIGSAQTVRIGGSNANQVLVLVDGRRLQELGNGEADLSAIPLDWIETLEVSRGGKTDEGGEAVGGILRITTRRSSERNELSAGGEVYPTYTRLSLLRSAKTGRFSGLLSYCRTQGAGNFRYRISNDDGVGQFTEHLGQSFRRANSDVARDQLLLKMASSLSESYAIEASGSTDRTTRGMPGTIAPQLTPEARQSTTQDAVNVRAMRTRGKDQIELRSSYQHNWRRYSDPDVYSMVHYSEETSRRLEEELRGSTAVARTALSSGAFMGRESLTSEQIAGTTAARTRWAGWAQAARPILASADNQTVLSGEAGLRWEKYGTGETVLPKASLSLDRFAPLRSGLTVSWGKSYRAPDFYSLFWLDDQAVQGNPDLHAEVSREWTARGYLESPWANPTKFEASVSDQWVGNLIFWRRTVYNRWKPFNLLKAHVETLDLSVTQSALSDALRLTAGVNWTEARDATNDRNWGGKYLTFRAPRTYRATLSAREYGLELLASYRWVAARPAIETNSVWLSEYQLLDASLCYRLQFRRVRIEPALGVNNLLNENYRIVRFAPMPGREIYAAIRIIQD